MLRFSVNRLWTSILALCLALSALFTTAVRADSFDPGTAETTDPGSYDPQGSGDPDDPDGPGVARGVRNGVQRRAGYSQTGVRSVGDGAFSGSAMLGKFHVAMLGLRKFYLRF